MSENLFLWLATYGLHSTALIGFVWLLERTRVLVDRNARECAWRVALVGGLFTATAQLLLPAQPVGSAPAVAATAAQPLTTQPSKAVVGSPVPRSAVSRPNLLVATTPGPKAPSTLEVARHDAPVAAPPARLTISPSVPMAELALAWLVFAGLAALAIALRLAALRRRIAALPACEDEDVANDVRRLAQKAGVAPPRVRLGDGRGSPMALAPDLLCLPAWSIEELDATQRRAMLAHEIAHFRRRDPWWQLFYQGYAHVLFFQPLHRLALRRLDQLAELACDDWARRAVDGRALAECLAVCAERVVARSPALALAMAKPRSPLIQRIQNLLEDAPMSHPIRTWSARIALAIVLPSLLLLPVLAIERVAFAGSGSGNSISIVDDMLGGHRFEADMENSEGRLEVKFKGKFEIADSEDDITRIDGSGSIEEQVGATTRRVEFSKADGAIKRRYVVDGKDQPFGPEAKEFLKRVLPHIMRESGYDAERRVARIKAKGGVEAVLAEIDLIRGSYAARVYVGALSEGTKLTQAQLEHVLARVEKMDGDYERRVSLTSLIEHQDMDAAAQSSVLRAVVTMNSDYEKRVVLTTLAPKLLSDAGTISAWGMALSKLDSDYEARVSVTAIAERKNVEPAMLAAALAATSHMDSDYEARVTLTDFVGHVGKNPALGQDYADATSRIGSDYERRVALTELVENVKLELDGYKAVLESAAGMSSDYECRVTLQALAEHMPPDAKLIERYRAVARKLGDYERGQAEKALDRFAVL